MSLLAGIHPVREALKAGLPLDRVLIARGAAGPRLQEIIELCRERDIPVRFEPRAQLDRAATNHPSGIKHQGVVAFGASARTATLEQAASTHGLIVLLDGIEDPHNLGAIIRTAHAAGASAAVIPERRAAGLTETVSRSAAGALAHLPVVRVANINRALEELKDLSYWIYGLDERGPLAYDQTDYTAPTAFVIGAEGRGLHEHTAKRCDFLIRIPMPAGGVASLNASVAAGVVLFEWRRRLTSKEAGLTSTTGAPRDPSTPASSPASLPRARSTPEPREP
jgi:23S rRNA (guanosine2251-2'-O)-methyltransferase